MTATRRFERRQGLVLWLVTTVILIALALLVTAPLHAQDAIPVPLATNTVTLPPAATAAPPVTMAAPNAPNPAETSSLLLLLVGGLVGAVATGAPLLYVITHMTKQQKDMAERLYQSTPDSFQTTFRAGLSLAEKVITVAAKIAGVLDEVTDGLPNTEPPAPLPAPTPPPPDDGLG